MKEKEIIRCSNKSNLKKIKIIVCILLAVIVIIAPIYLFANNYTSEAWDEYNSCKYMYSSLDSAMQEDFGYESDYSSTSDCWTETEEKFQKWDEYGLIRDVSMGILIVLSPLFIVLLLVLLLTRNMELVITNKRVYGKSYFGKRVDLPIDSISAIGKNILFGIKVSTSSGRINWILLENRDNVYEYISKLILKRQNKESSENVKYENSNNNYTAADELKKYKELLDSNAITQEEYDKKKKDLLDL